MQIQPSIPCYKSVQKRIVQIQQMQNVFYGNI